MSASVVTTERTVLNPFFTDTGRGDRFAISSSPLSEPKGSILFVHPFAEEMNKSRRMAALAARALADDGWHVLRADLQGCGDSEGDSGEATWSGWLADIDFWADWLQKRARGPMLIWGLRAGALLATSWLARTRASTSLLLWQPVTNGQQHLTQFLRLRAASEMLDSRNAGGVVSQLRQELLTGSMVTVAGYDLNPEMANPLAEARLGLPEEYGGSIRILEVQAADASPSPAFQRLLNKWREAGIPAHCTQVTGPPFWNTSEIETAPDLIQATVDAAGRLIQ